MPGMDLFKNSDMINNLLLSVRAVQEEITTGK